MFKIFQGAHPLSLVNDHGVDDDGVDDDDDGVDDDDDVNAFRKQLPKDGHKQRMAAN